MEEMDTEIACIRLGGKKLTTFIDSFTINATTNYLLLTYGNISDYLPWLSVFDLDGHKAIIKKAYAKATKHIDIEVDHRIQTWKDGNKSLEEDILDVLIMLKDTNGNPLMNVKEIKAQVLTI
ncbi:hypothetical protein KY285_019146 [Solanum tuberosum]|nr:hypothetical protein KY285_019146 [Solanum tuberosum]